LRLSQFRNYESADIDLEPGFNLFIGPNAQGKTNLLEAVYLLSTTRLLRTSRDAEAIGEGHTSSIVEGDLIGGRTTVTCKLERGIRKRVLLNGMPLKRASDVIGRIPNVCLSSMDMVIAQGEPADRRMFMDLELSQTYPAYLHHLSQYKRSLEQRNSLLRAAQEGYVDETSLETWEAPLASHGAELRLYRTNYIRDLNALAGTIHPQIAVRESIELNYIQKDEAVTESDLLASLAQLRRQDIQRGTTTIGPHRDDIEIIVAGRDVRTFGSQGQQRTSVLTIKLSSLKHIQNVLGDPPVLLLDDMLSDLDERRRAALVEWVCDHAGQAILTCTEKEAAGKRIVDQAKIFKVIEGTVTKA
jgi:DNA replication and repair protein RecF